MHEAFVKMTGTAPSMSIGQSSTTGARFAGLST
jgi:hypothetical protein